MIPKRPSVIPPRPKTITFQPNPVFQDESDMVEWVKVNVPGGKIVRTWKMEMMACEVESEIKNIQAHHIKKKKLK